MSMCNLRKVLATLLGAVCFVGSSSPAWLQPQAFDHLKCYPIKKDTVKKGKWTADLVPGQSPPFEAAAGCEIRGKPKFFCTEVAKVNVNPEPPAVPPGPDAGDWLCYKLRCPKRQALKLPLADQFGEHEISIKRPHWFCAPARKLPSNTSTTTTSTTTSTTTTVPRCGPCVSDGDCPPGMVCNALSVCLSWCECPLCLVCAGLCVP